MSAPILSNIQSMTSREIAQLTGKTHGNVCRDVRNMRDSIREKDDSELNHKLNQELAESLDVRGYIDHYSLGHDLTMTLISGYDTALRLKVVARWRELEQKHAVPQNFAEALQLAADQQRKIEQMKPMAELGQAMAETEAKKMREWISSLKTEHGNVKEKATINLLIEKKYLYRNADGRLCAYAEWDDLFVMKQVLCNDGRYRPSLHIRGKGMERLYHLVIAQ